MTALRAVDGTAADRAHGYVRSQAVAARLDMHDKGLTSRWFGLTTRQYRKTLGAEPRPVR